jgi:5-methylcytosine-specific restriction protein A
MCASFVQTLMERIIEGAMIPKVQTERELGPILDVFLDEIVTEAFRDDSRLSGPITTICREFPFKKPDLDRWHDGVLHYTGMGQTGDQKLDRQNRTLAESDHNGVAVYLAEVFAANEYTYMGRVVLAGAPYQEEQADAGGVLRKVWMFPLCLAAGKAPAAVPLERVARAAHARERAAKRLSDAELAERAKGAAKEASRRPTTSTTYERDPYISELAKRRALGHCQLCGQPAPFENKKGEPYLETHHIVWLARGGEDAITNTVALCPNCHRRMHELDAGATSER